MNVIDIDDLLLQRREAARHALVDYRSALQVALAQENVDTHDRLNHGTSLVEISAAMRVLWMERT